jgi:hypothetical protein
MAGACSGTNCWAHIDWHCEHAGIVRVFAGGDRFNEDPYCYALPFVVRERFGNEDERHGLIEFEGVHDVMRPCQFRAIRTAMRAAGWGVLSTRIKNGVSRTVEICKARTAGEKDD